MKNVLVALMITTGAVACADNRPAQQPTTTTSATTSTAVTKQEPTPAPQPPSMIAPLAAQTPLNTDTTGSSTATTTGTTSSMQSSSDTSSAPILGSTRSTAANDSSGTLATSTTTGNKLTPMDQGGAKGDRDITAAIRRSVVGDSSLSFAGKNVKIITKEGHVTLRGQVKTDAEKSSIDAKAHGAAGVVDVDNQLEIKK